MKIKAAVYHPETIPAFQGKPFIEALAPRFPIEEIARQLQKRPPYSDDQRLLPAEDRGMLVQILLRLFQPFEKDIDIYHKVERCIRWGYVDRDPFSDAFIRQQQHEYKAQQGNADSVPYTQSYPNTSGFALLGISGLGKSTTLRQILQRHDQVIQHSCYHGIPFNELQITWIHMDCPSDGSLKNLCSSFFDHVDKLIGSNYHEQYSGKKYNLDTMRIAMARIARSLHLGLLIIDEVQALCVAKDATIPIKTLNFLVTLVNTIGVPVILVGTPRALSFLQKEFQQAKRASGQGDALWDRMQNNNDWRLFVHSIWKYQYTRRKIELTEEILNALYEEAVGIPFLAVNIYKLVQEHAIYSGEESFTARSFHTIASRKMGLTREMRKALQSGKDINLQKYLDLTPFSPADYKATLAQEINAPEPDAPAPVPKHSLREQSIQALLAFGIDRPIAAKHVDRALAQNPGCSHSALIAREAYGQFLHAASSKASAETDPAVPQLPVGFSEASDAGYVGL